VPQAKRRQSIQLETVQADDIDSTPPTRVVKRYLSLQQAQLYGYEPTTGKLRAGFVESGVDQQAIAEARRRLASEKKGPLPHPLGPGLGNPQPV
jgi:hypothetical protein